MKFVDSSVSIVETHTSLHGIYEDIERAGRYSYQSLGTRYFNVPDDKDEKVQKLIAELKDDEHVSVEQGAEFDHSYYVSIPNNILVFYPDLLNYEEETLETSPRYKNVSAKPFVDHLVNNKHMTPLEFGAIYLTFNKEQRGLVKKYVLNPYSRVVEKTFPKVIYAPEVIVDQFNTKGDPETFYFVTTNARVICENGWEDDLKYLTKPTAFHEKRVTVKVTASIGVTREWNRSRSLGIVELSTRWCNFSKDKFGKELTFIVPSWAYKLAQEPFYKEQASNEKGHSLMQVLTCLDRTAAAYWDCLERAEEDYMYLLSGAEGAALKPQDARGVFPLDLKSEAIYCGYESDWEHFFELRTAQGAHPDIRKLAIDLKKQMTDAKIHGLF